MVGGAEEVSSRSGCEVNRVVVRWRLAAAESGSGWSVRMRRRRRREITVEAIDGGKMK